ncbi:hypothetical protein OBBRIDRAFT_883324 [Obba rivulosa]|uniref:Uncharacterized protein n=1 Tax=Obba rivulosa TaxID=1052685 RepID=A0A8E2DUY4_9APHY|nr:hypothetical protein OBBRIDRAFT_883324 [Obba rivulosa]
MNHNTIPPNHGSNQDGGTNSSDPATLAPLLTWFAQMVAAGHISLPVAIPQQHLVAQTPQLPRVPQLPRTSQVTPVPLQNARANVLGKSGSAIDGTRASISSAPPPQMMNTAPGYPGTPVGGFHDDERHLIQSLVDAENNKKTYLQALEDLHGVNNHSAAAWKDYYLANHKRLNELVATALIQPRHAIASWSVSSTRRVQDYRGSASSGSSPSSSSTQDVKPARRCELPRSIPPPHQKLLPERSAKPSTQRARKLPTKIPKQKGPSAPAMTENKRKNPPFEHVSLYPNFEETRIPDIPPRTPSPPTRIEKRGRGNRFTEEDHEYFIAFLQRRLLEHPGLTRDEICEMLGEKVPHHTAAAWLSYWVRNHTLPDKIIAAAHARAPQSVDEDSSERYESARSSSPSMSGESNEDDLPDADQDAKQMSSGPITSADLRVIARFQLSYDSWNSMSNEERWEVFHAKYPIRSAENWAKLSRKYRPELDGWVRKLRRKTGTTSSSTHVASESAGETSSSKKRKATSSPGFLTDYPEKRLKVEE